MNNDTDLTNEILDYVTRLKRIDYYEVDSSKIDVKINALRVELEETNRIWEQKKAQILADDVEKYLKKAGFYEEIGKQPQTPFLYDGKAPEAPFFEEKPVVKKAAATVIFPPLGAIMFASDYQKKKEYLSQKSQYEEKLREHNEQLVENIQKKNEYEKIKAEYDKKADSIKEKYLKNYKQSENVSEEIEKLNAYYSNKSLTLSQNIDEIEFERKTACEDTIVAEKYRTHETLMALIGYFEDKRAESIKEAVNLFCAEQFEKEKLEEIKNELKSEAKTQYLNEICVDNRNEPCYYEYCHDERDLDDDYEENENHILADVVADVACGLVEGMARGIGNIISEKMGCDLNDEIDEYNSKEY